jgi:hypothetical protein
MAHQTDKEEYSRQAACHRSLVATSEDDQDMFRFWSWAVFGIDMFLNMNAYLTARFYYSLMSPGELHPPQQLLRDSIYPTGHCRLCHLSWMLLEKVSAKEARSRCGGTTSHDEEGRGTVGQLVTSASSLGILPYRRDKCLAVTARILIQAGVAVGMVILTYWWTAQVDASLGFKLEVLRSSTPLGTKNATIQDCLFSIVD